MFLGIAFIAAYSFFVKPSSLESRYFEPDASGNFRQVLRAEPIAKTLPPLLKPEPQLLEENKSSLNLTVQQCKQLREISNQWLNEKSALVAEIESISSSARPKSQTKLSLTAIQGSLSGYSEVSRAYNEARNRYWSSAVALLGSEQKSVLEKLLHSTQEVK
jgi:hypothetical protein